MRLYVNIDHVATIREARKTDEPDPVAAAALCEAAGADGITVHLREDRRHIHDHDVERLARPRGGGAGGALFITPPPAAIETSAKLGVPAVELHTGRYAHTWRESD